MVPKKTYYVPQRVLTESQGFLQSCGLEGYEGTALWIGRSDGDAVRITRLFVPEQVPTKSEWGLAVDFTARAHYTLTDNLEAGEQFYIRIHSHPGRAYHSERDDANCVITHEGALSIVVPNFAADPIQLARCAIYRLEHGRGWLPLDESAICETFQVVP